MTKKIEIAPISRVEGHGKVTLEVDDDNKLIDAKFHVLEFRGFEKFLQGRKVWELPRIVTRSCGICPISHHLASAKACDDMFEVEIPTAAKLTRELHHMAQMIHSHSLHFFFLASPDFLFPDDEAKRNVLGIIDANPNLAKQAIELRKMGQTINEIIGGKAIHPVTSIPGGMSKKLTTEEVHNIHQKLKRAMELTKSSLDVAKMIFSKNIDFIKSFADIKTNFAGLVKDGNLEMYDGNIRIISPEGKIINEFDPREYLNYIGERVESWSWLKFPYYKPLGWPDGTYRVNSLARLNVCDQISTPLANEELKSFRKQFGRYPSQTLLFHYGRIIELMYAVERGLELIKNSELTSGDIRKKLTIRGGEGVGVIEAPRGILIHHYKADDKGTVQRVNMIVSTVQNNPAMNQAVLSAAKDVIDGTEITESVLNRIEMAVRAYDPCLSCATHAVGKMPLIVQIQNKAGDIIKEIIKN
jgi:coenzyme F420-reducing hydrogenase alpha subunit